MAPRKKKESTIDKVPNSKTVKIQDKEYKSGPIKYRCDFDSYEEYYKYDGPKG
jgi:hypothetical protein